AVHATGPIRVVEDRGELLEIVRRSVAFYESAMPRPWVLDPSDLVMTRLLPQIVGFRLEVRRLEGKWKMNQNHPPERRGGGGPGAAGAGRHGRRGRGRAHPGDAPRGGPGAVDLTYQQEPGLTPEEFVDVLVRSTLAERRPVHDAGAIRSMLAHADLILTARS